jgi:hypothetical protein
LRASAPAPLKETLERPRQKWRLRHPAVANSLDEAGDRLVTFTTLPLEPMERRTNHQRHRAAGRHFEGEIVL